MALLRRTIHVNRPRNHPRKARALQSRASRGSWQARSSPARRLADPEREGEQCIRHCEEPTGPARSGRPDDKLRDEAIQNDAAALDYFASLAMTNTRSHSRASKKACGSFPSPQHWWLEQAIVRQALEVRERLVQFFRVFVAE